MTTKTKSGRSPTTFASSSTSSPLKSMRCVRRSPRRFRKRPSSFPRWPATPKRSGTTSCTTPMSAEPWITSARSARACSPKPRVSSKASGRSTRREPSSTRRASGTPSLARSTKLESLTGLEGEQRLKESWKELGKDTVHWDEWSTNPFQAAGESAFDLATVLLPGGALEKLPMLGRAAAEVAEAPKDLHLPTPGRLPDPAPHDNPPPRNEPPRSGQPQPAPQPDPAPKPKAALPPYGLTESKTPAGQKPPVAAPKPAVEPANGCRARGPIDTQGRRHTSQPAHHRCPSPARNRMAAHRAHTNLSHWHTTITDR